MSQINIGAISEALNNKADIQDLHGVDDSAVHKAGNETITGFKTINVGDSQWMDSIRITNPLIQNNYSNPSDNTDRYIAGKTVDGDYYSWITLSKTAAGVTKTSLNVRRRDSSTDSNHDAQISVSIDSNNVARCDLPANTYGTNFHGTATQALWADLAENYQSDEKYPIGTLIKFGGEKDITVADNNCNGVISDKPGYLLDAELEDSQPVALVGKTPVRIIGKVNKHDKITLSEISGVGRAAKDGEKVIARSLESSDIEEEKLVKCVIKFNLD